MPRLKISGITNEEDAKWAAILGVEFVSVSMEDNSEKKISIDKAVQIKSMLPSYTRFIVDLGEIEHANLRLVKKINPFYVQFKNNTKLAGFAINDKLQMLETNTIYEIMPGRCEDVSGESISDGNNENKVLQQDFEIGEKTVEDTLSSVDLYQITLAEAPSEEQLNEIKDTYPMENIIIEGDWELPAIKKACTILQPYAWSIKSVIEKSPRKIDYNLMKKYIREIALW